MADSQGSVAGRFRIGRKFDQLEYYVCLVNPLVPRAHRVCRSFGRRVREWHGFLEDSQSWPQSRLTEYRDAKLRALITHACANVPYYRDVFRRSGLHAGDIATAEDLGKLPVLTKDTIRENFPVGIVGPWLGDPRDGIWTTGGSTGTPLEFYSDPRASDVAWGAFFRFLRWHGYQWGDGVAVFFRPFALRDERPALHRYLDHVKNGVVPNVKYYDGSRLSDADLAHVVDDLLRRGTRILRGYSSALVRLAEYCEDVGRRVQPRFITTTGEVLYDWQRQALRHAFGCEVFDQYGCAEVMGVGFECREWSGLHVAEEHCVVEVVREDASPAAPGERGLLLLTDLDNYRMPFIRYLVGDEGRIETGTCGCGRVHPRLGGIDGRACDLLRGVNGRTAHGLFFVTLLQDADWFGRFGVRDFEVVQLTEDRFDIRIVSAERPGSDEQQSFAELCRRYFGNMEFRVEFVNTIPRNAAAKRRYTRYEVR